VWGKGAWIYLHTSALTYPSDDDLSLEASKRRVAFRQELHDLPLVVPCSECRGHLAQELSKVNMDAIGSYDAYNSLILWLHNQVRLRQGKSAMSVPDLMAWLQKEGLELGADCDACAIQPALRSEKRRPKLSSAESYKVATVVLSVVLAASLLWAAGSYVTSRRRRRS